LELLGDLLACHQGAETGATFFRGKIMVLSCYNFVAISNPSPTGINELTQ
jgi:hypothetical protein